MASDKSKSEITAVSLAPLAQLVVRNPHVPHLINLYLPSFLTIESARLLEQKFKQYLDVTSSTLVRGECPFFSSFFVLFPQKPFSIQPVVGADGPGITILPHTLV